MLPFVEATQQDDRTLPGENPSHSTENPDVATAPPAPPSPPEPQWKKNLRLGPGLGRPKGTKNRLTYERRKFIDMVVGEVDSQERADFALAMRTQIMNGTAHPNVVTYFLQMWLGKPKESIDVRIDQSEIGSMSDRDVAHEALKLARRLLETQVDQPVIDVETEPS